jgi:hypothetical protein
MLYCKVSIISERLIYVFEVEKMFCLRLVELVVAVNKTFSSYFEEEANCLILKYDYFRSR